MREAEDPTIELLNPGRLEVDVYTFDVTLHLPNEDAPTYIYVFDSSQEGTKYARDVGLIHSVTYGPVDQMATHGKCSIHHTLDYTYDCVQVYFGFSQAVGLWHAIYGVKEMPRTMLHRHWFPIRRNDTW